MKTFYLLLFALTIGAFSWGQVKSELSLTRQGNKHMADSNFIEAELKYMEALNIDDYDTASYNLALAQYRQGKWEESKSGWSTLEKTNDNKVIQSMSSFAQGMACLRSSDQTESGQPDYEKIEESLEHFKQAMRYAPGNEAARHNYRLLKAMMQQQPPQQNQNQDGEGDDSQDQNNQDQAQNNDSGDQGEQNQDQQSQGNDQQDQNQEGENQQNQGDDQSKQGQEDQSSGQGEDERKNGQQDAQQPKEGQISKEQALRLLEALGKQEQETLEKIKAKKAKGKSKKNKKDW